ncbi:hypothetical protein ASPWEDRAFT_104592 [Aspergillus wentii DTO 134E9]|uniref:Photolyase/cryptochrome alpha/beta domain-containing protein n=1 Tax=Aspergillus wentii DTO 134E9 TaxID=1073089 RepID=A0A1L9RUG3_ASPWE|nr:uncharacterized protein ASPWEDRAFT_104592 [Aspergillus wentii DTO 134E9]KAI9934135.1 hypothetical protein MW887_005208 [Aspergillus wentii]OJJ38508.1 hypothetical protein ASPWEDRAFT_104592 [Aspergillus wentii DTO 134E9]
MPNKPVVLYWHRTDLRLHDSPALHHALSLKPSIFIPIWTWDPHYVYRSRVGPNRWQFLLECQKDLSSSYTKLNCKQKLWVVREAPQTVLPKLWKQWKVTHIVWEKDTDAYARDRDQTVIQMAEKAGVEVIIKMGRTLFDPDELVSKNDGKPTMSMSQVEKAAEKIGNGHPEKPLDPPKQIPDPWDEDKMDLGDLDRDIPDAKSDINNLDKKQYSDIMGPNQDFSVPTLAEIGIDSSQATTPHHGGESIALQTLTGHIQNEEYVGTFEKPKTSPADFNPQSTTLLSPHLHFGSLSVRRFWWDVQSVLDKRKRQKKHTSDVPVNLPGQLLFRDMYFAAQSALGASFAQIHGNKVARFIDWHLQSDEDGGYTVDFPEAETWYKRWKDGKTGFPWIDALMRQLRIEGWMHHLGRHSVACFLTRGGCYVHWERGAEVFEEWLIDHETACNIGNWQWLSCTAFFSQYHRCYSPITFGKKWDANGELIRQYCPELRNFNKKYIYEPWRAPISDQKKWGCRVTGSGEEDGEGVYPKPMFDFDERRQTCMDGMKKAYGIGLHGDDAEVMDGTWKNEFGVDERPHKKRRVDE